MTSQPARTSLPTPPPRRAGGFGIPLWSALSILIAALATGVLLSVLGSDLGWQYLACFAVGALLTSLLVEVRGLSIFAACVPIFFAFATPVASWFVSDSMAPDASKGSLGRADMVAAVYPLAVFFPALLIVTLLVCFIGLLRYLAARNRARARAAALARARRKEQSADRANVAATTRVRTRRARGERPQQVTVDELLRTRGATHSSRRRASASGERRVVVDRQQTTRLGRDAPRTRPPRTQSSTAYREFRPREEHRDAPHYRDSRRDSR